jgi:primosomal protein N' (replication factor Y) (superfamily II helicase)
MVRVPLGGRRVRGYVVDVDTEGEQEGLRPIASISGDVPVFDDALLASLRWVASHYVAPLATVLERACPPNNPRRQHSVRIAAPAPAEAGDPISGVVEDAVAGRLRPPTVLLSAHAPVTEMGATVARLLEAGKSSMIVTATAHEAIALHAALAVDGRYVLAHGDMSDRDLTAAWGAVQSPAVLVGTPRIACWPVSDLGAAVVLEEGRRAMKDRQTPTLHVRDVLRRRAQQERFQFVVVGPTPTTEVLSTGPRLVRSPGRLWGLVEVIDRRQETSGGAILTDPARRALAAVTKRGGRSFVFGHRKGYAAATRCVTCRTVRRCPGCGSRPDPGSACTRCGIELAPCETCGGTRFEPLGAGVGRIVADVGRVVGADAVAAAPASAPVTVGTERDILDLAELDLVVLPDLDGLIHGTNYRSGEDALRLGARLAGLVGRGSGRRMMVQTSDPDHHVVRALVRGDPLPALQSELEARRPLGYPPFGELLVVETSGGPAPVLDELSDDCSVLGPAPHGDGTRWLLQADDLTAAKSALRLLVQRWRDSGLRVRIDVDPIDL